MASCVAVGVAGTIPSFKINGVAGGTLIVPTDTRNNTTACDYMLFTPDEYAKVMALVSASAASETSSCVSVAEAGTTPALKINGVQGGSLIVPTSASNNTTSCDYMLLTPAVYNQVMAYVASGGSSATTGGTDVSADIFVGVALVVCFAVGWIAGAQR